VISLFLRCLSLIPISPSVFLPLPYFLFFSASKVGSHFPDLAFLVVQTSVFGPSFLYGSVLLFDSALSNSSFPRLSEFNLTTKLGNSGSPSSFSRLPRRHLVSRSFRSGLPWQEWSFITPGGGDARSFRFPLIPPTQSLKGPDTSHLPKRICPPTLPSPLLNLVGFFHARDGRFLLSLRPWPFLLITFFFPRDCIGKRLFLFSTSSLPTFFLISLFCSCEAPTNALFFHIESRSRPSPYFLPLKMLVLTSSPFESTVFDSDTSPFCLFRRI